MPNKPQPFEATVDISDLLEDLYGRDDLNFEIILSGKTKTVDLPHNRTLDLSPGLTVSFLNLDTGETSGPFNITGPRKTTFHEDGSTDVVVTGHNLNADPFILGGSGGLVFTTGRFTFSFDSNGNLSQSLSGNGLVVDFLDVL